jgi:hypothetical protein
MKLSAVLLTGLMASAVSAYRIDLWSQSNYQGVQRSYVCTFRPPCTHFHPTMLQLRLSARFDY